MIERYSYLAFVLLGVIAPVHGLALPHLIEGYSLTLGTAGLVFFAGSLGYITASASYPWLQRSLGVKHLLGIGALITAGSLVLLPVMPLWSLALVVAYLTGLGSGTIEVGFNALVAGLEPPRAKTVMNWLHFAFSVGALSGPIVLSRLTVWTGWWMLLYWSGAVLFLLFAGIWYQQGMAQTAVLSKDEATTGGAQVYGRGGFWLLLVSMFIYCGAEVALAGWITTYLITELFTPVETAAMGISFLWGGLTVGRAVCGKLSPHVDTRTLLLALCTGSSVFTAVTAGTKVLPMALTSVFLTGLFFSAIFPTLILHGTAMYPRSLTEVSGGLVTAAGLGSLVIPSMLGLVAEYASLSAGIFIVAGMLLLSAVLLLFVPRERSLRDTQMPVMGRDTSEFA